MRRLILGIATLVAAMSLAITSADAHPAAAGGCNPASDGHGSGGPTATNPATGGEYWIAPGFLGISGGTGYVVGDANNRTLAVSNADGTSQARASQGGICISAAGQTQKIGEP